MHIDRPISIALILFVILLLMYFLVVPEYHTFKTLQTELGKKTAEYNAEVDYYAAIAKSYADLKIHQDDITKVDGALSKDPALASTIYFLQETAKENGLMVKDLFLSKSSPVNSNNNVGGSVKDMVFSIDLIGDYPSLGGFMMSLEKSSRIFEITNISFGSSSGLSNNFNLQVKTYSY